MEMEIEQELEKMVEVREKESNRLRNLVNENYGVPIRKVIEAYDAAWKWLPSCIALMKSAHQEGMEVFTALYDDKSEQAYQRAQRTLNGQ